MSLRVAPGDPRYVNVTAKVFLDGNFFTRDPGKTLRANVRDMLDGLAAEMEGQVKGIISGAAGAMPHYTGWSYQHTKGYTTSGFTGRRWQTWAAVTAYTADLGAKDAIRTKAKVAGRHNPIDKTGRNIGTTPGIEGRFHPYRRVKAGVYRLRPVLTANLTKGLE